MIVSAALKMATLEHVKSSTNNYKRKIWLKALARDVFDRSRPSINTVAEKQDCSIHRVSQEECAKLRESVPYVKAYRYNPKHLYPKLNGYGDNAQRSLKL
jgi:hypothetical protein